MKCELCGKEYRSLPNHLRRTHEVAPEDYREAYGILKGVPLVDLDVSEAIRRSINSRLQDPEYRQTMTEICMQNARNLKISLAGKSSLGKAGAASLAEHRKHQNEKYVKSKALIVAAILDAKKTIEDVRRDSGISPAVVKKILALGLATYSRRDSGIESAKRSLATKRKNAKS